MTLAKFLHLSRGGGGRSGLLGAFSPSKAGGRVERVGLEMK